MSTVDSYKITITAHWQSSHSKDQMENNQSK